MEFKEKNKIIRGMISPEFVKKDRELLELHIPGHELLYRSVNSKKETLDAEILFVLLDKLTPQQIEEHRTGIQASPGTTPPVEKRLTEPPADPVKKNSQKKRSTPGSAGRTSKTRMSRKPS